MRRDDTPSGRDRLEDEAITLSVGAVEHYVDNMAEDVEPAALFGINDGCLFRFA
jgi:hypothetical protein